MAKVKILNTKQAGEALGVSDSRIRQLILEGRLSAIKYGRDWLIKEKDLEKVRDRGRPGRPNKKERE